MKLNNLLICLFSLVIFSTGCAGNSVTVTVQGSGDSIVKARPGKTVSIQLRSQLSTGYSWKAMEIPESLTLVKENVIPEDKSVEIAGGYEMQEFVFETSKTGGVIVFKYAQHWRKKPDYVKTANIKVEIE